MVDLIEAARLLWVPGLVNLNGKPQCSMQEWLASANFAPSVSGSKVELNGIDQRHLLRALGGDINRLASAASETLRNVVEISELPKSLAWPYVKIYYASLFYAHTTLRIWGRSPSYLKTSDLLPIRQTLNAYGLHPPFKLQTGQFLIYTDMAVPLLTIETDKGGGGSHEAIWRELNRALSEFKRRVSLANYLSSDKAKIDSQLSVATDLLTDRGSNLAWPSQMRNEIQYRQGEGLWYPYKGHNRAADLVLEIRKMTKASVSVNTALTSTGDALARFRAACNFVIIFARGIIADLFLNSNAKSFLRFGQTQFETAFK